MKNTAIFLLLIFAFCVTLFAQTEKCFQGGWVEDKDPNGTNVRSSPDIKGKIIGVIPAARDLGEEATVEIVGYSNGWLKISSAENVEGEKVFKGIGWISAKKIATAAQTSNDKPATLYLKPSRSSKKVGTIPIEANFTILGFDCFGLKVSYKGKTGWLSRDDLCGNPRTTCS